MYPVRSAHRDEALVCSLRVLQISLCRYVNDTYRNANCRGGRRDKLDLKKIHRGTNFLSRHGQIRSETPILPDVEIESLLRAATSPEPLIFCVNFMSRCLLKVFDCFDDIYDTILMKNRKKYQHLLEYSVRSWICVTVVLPAANGFGRFGLPKLDDFY